MKDASMVDDIFESYKSDLQKVLEYVKGEFAVIRAGRANPHILDKIMIDYYGTMTPLYQMANISAPEARVLVVNVWDYSQAKNIAKAISVADIGVSPIEDGKNIRLIFPILTEEKRKDIVKMIKKLSEEAKVSMRSGRRDCLDLFKQMKKEGDISEDEFLSIEKEVQKILDGYSTEIEKLTENKEKEVMTI